MSSDGLTGSEKEGLYKAIFSRRDVRSHFVDREVPDDVLLRILNAAHHAPSVGFSQPWNFVLIKDRAIRQKVKDSFLRERERSSSMLDGNEQRQKQYVSLKLEGILESAVNICVTYDPTRFGPFVQQIRAACETRVREGRWPDFSAAESTLYRFRAVDGEVRVKVGRFFEPA